MIHSKALPECPTIQDSAEARDDGGGGGLESLTLICLFTVHLLCFSDDD